MEVSEERSQRIVLPASRPSVTTVAPRRASSAAAA
jgi:hypothetical protein